MRSAGRSIAVRKDNNNNVLLHCVPTYAQRYTFLAPYGAKRRQRIMGFLCIST